MLTTDFNYAVSMVKMVSNRRYNARFRYSNRHDIPVTNNNVKLVRNIRGFKTAKPENIELLVFNRQDLESKYYMLVNTKTGTERNIIANR